MKPSLIGFSLFSLKINRHGIFVQHTIFPAFSLEYVLVNTIYNTMGIVDPHGISPWYFLNSFGGKKPQFVEISNFSYIERPNKQ